MWLIEDAPPGFEQTPRAIANRIMAVNFASIHTSSMVCSISTIRPLHRSNDSLLQTFTQALLHIAATPAWLDPLREEVESIVKEEGWTKASVRKMKKVDSFMRESSRVNPIGLCTFFLSTFRRRL